MTRVALLLAAVALVATACGGAATPDPTDGGRTLYRASCQVCHGQSGEGGVGRALDTVVATFPECADQIRWVTLGSERWKAEVGPTVGGREVGSGVVMPSFEASLTAGDIARIVAYERSAFGGVAADVALDECGLPPRGSGE